MDVGGDKVLPYLRQAAEENPALGWRAIRLSLDRPGLLRTQVRALLRATAGAELRLLLPMVTAVGEIGMARALIDREIDLLRRRGSPLPTHVLLGAMIEVPALLFELDALLPLVDFVSVGSNDLLQYLFAADRNNARVAGQIRSSLRGAAAGIAHDRPDRRAPCQAVIFMWRNGWPSPRSDGPARARLPRHLDGSGLNRANQIDGDEPRRFPAGAVAFQASRGGRG